MTSRDDCAQLARSHQGKDERQQDRDYARKSPSFDTTTRSTTVEVKITIDQMAAIKQTVGQVSTPKSALGLLRYAPPARTASPTRHPKKPYTLPASSKPCPRWSARGQRTVAAVRSTRYLWPASVTSNTSCAPIIRGITNRLSSRTLITPLSGRID